MPFLFQAALGAHERMTSNRRVARLARKVKERWKAMDDAKKEQMLYRKATRKSGNDVDFPGFINGILYEIFTLIHTD